jgi:5,10-methylenetetrahydromethanopterin reductase
MTDITPAGSQRVALYLQDKHPIRDGLEYARYAEQKGFEAVWQAESRLVRDAIVPMAAYAAATDRIAVGSGVINNWTRNIGLLAATFLTLDDLAPDRIICGIGAWWDPLAKNVGIDRRKPLTAMRETVEVIWRWRTSPFMANSTMWTASSWTWCTVVASRATYRS